MLNNPENTEEIVNELNEVEIKIKNLKTLLKNKEGRFWRLGAVIQPSIVDMIQILTKFIPIKEYGFE